MPRRDRHDNQSCDVESSIGFLVYRVHQHASAEFRRSLEPIGLTPPQFGVLAQLCARNEQRQAAICERTAIDPNTMVGIVDRLEGAGLVKRCRDPKDRRAYLVAITPRGRRTLRRCTPLRDQAAARTWAGLSSAEQDELRTLLRKVLQLSGPGAHEEDRANG